MFSVMSCAEALGLILSEKKKEKKDGAESQWQACLLM